MRWQYHVLHQAGAVAFLALCIHPDGVLVTHDTTKARWKRRRSRTCRTARWRWRRTLIENPAAALRRHPTAPLRGPPAEPPWIEVHVHPACQRRLKKAIKLAWPPTARPRRSGARLAPASGDSFATSVVPQARLADVYSSPHILVTLEALPRRSNTWRLFTPCCRLPTRVAARQWRAWPARAVA
jgi:hypothetical protein